MRLPLIALTAITAGIAASCLIAGTFPPVAFFILAPAYALLFWLLDLAQREPAPAPELTPADRARIWGTVPPPPQRPARVNVNEWHVVKGRR